MNQNVCSKNKFGFCRFGETCRYKHVNIRCEENDCEIQSCKMRHPRACTYYRDFRRCKFGTFCSYDHRNVEEKVEYLERIVVEKAKKVELLENKFIELENKFATVKNAFENVEKTVEEHVTKLFENIQAATTTPETISSNLIETSQVMIKEMKETVVTTLMKRQDDLEAKNLARFDSFYEQLTMISHLMKPIFDQMNMSSPIKLSILPLVSKEIIS